MENEILVSVVVPIYNAEKYLESCISSLLNQTYQHIEIILVDDGSPDSCPDLCDRLSRNNEKIKVIHQTNQGVSTARNVGTAYAKGQYITYVDADDIIATECIENGINLITATNSDIVIGAIKNINRYSEFDTNRRCDNNLYECISQKDFDQLKSQYFNQNIKKFINIQGGGRLNRGPYARIIKAEIAKDCKFNKEHKIGEDFLWNLELLKRCKKVCISYNIWYGYLIYASSAIRRYYGNREQFVSEYLRDLYNNNEDFIQRNKSDYVKAVAVEFYCLLNFEYNSSLCPFTKKEKNSLAKKIRKKEPWRILFTIKSFFALSFKYKLLIIFVRLNLWQPFLNLKKRK